MTALTPDGAAGEARRIVGELEALAAWAEGQGWLAPSRELHWEIEDATRNLRAVVRMLDNAELYGYPGPPPAGGGDIDVNTEAP